MAENASSNFDCNRDGWCTRILLDEEKRGFRRIINRIDLKLTLCDQLYRELLWRWYKQNGISPITDRPLWPNLVSTNANRCRNNLSNERTNVDVLRSGFFFTHQWCYDRCDPRISRNQPNFPVRGRLGRLSSASSRWFQLDAETNVFKFRLISLRFTSFTWAIVVLSDFTILEDFQC